MATIREYLLINPNQTTAQIAAAIGWTVGKVSGVLYDSPGVFTKHGRGGRHSPHTWTAN